MQDYFKDLQIFNPVKIDDYIEFTVPLVLNFCNSLLMLRIDFLENGGYRISTAEDYFDEESYNAKYYYEKFYNTNHFKTLKVKDDNTIYKEFEYDYNIQVAVSYFVKFFTFFDEFINEVNSTITYINK